MTTYKLTIKNESPNMDLSRLLDIGTEIANDYGWDENQVTAEPGQLVFMIEDEDDEYQEWDEETLEDEARRIADNRGWPEPEREELPVHGGDVEAGAIVVYNHVRFVEQFPHTMHHSLVALGLVLGAELDIARRRKVEPFCSPAHDTPGVDNLVQ